MVGLLLVLVLLLSACSPAELNPADPAQGLPGAGIGFGEELFRLKGRVDYLYAHVARNQKKNALEIQELRRAVDEQSPQPELAALKEQMASMRAALSGIQKKMSEAPEVALLAQEQKKISALGLRSDRRLGVLEEKVRSLSSSVKKSEQELSGLRSAASETASRTQIDKLRRAVAALTKWLSSLQEQAGEKEKPLVRRVRQSVSERAAKNGHVTDGGVPAAAEFKDFPLRLVLSDAAIPDPVAERIGLVAARHDGERFRVVAFVSSPDAPSKEVRLAKRAAQAVREELTGRGIEPDRVTMTVAVGRDLPAGGQVVEVQVEGGEQ